MAITRPTGEQLRFRSQYTGDHILDTYLEAAEKGGRTLADLLDDLFDGSGVFRSENFEFRFEQDKLQFRAGVYANPSAGWQDVTTFFNITGTFNASTTYNNFDLVTLSTKDVYIVHDLTAPTTFSSEAALISSANTEKLVDVSEARDWASKTTGQVQSTDYSAKAYAVGGTGIDTTTGSAKDWAIKTNGTVGNTSEYSAKYWATSPSITTVASGISNINAVAADISNVNAVGSNITNVNTTAGIAANITAVANIQADVTTTANINANITTVANISTNVTSVANNQADVSTVATEINNNNLQTVANDIQAIITAADDLNEATSEIDTVANSITNVDAVGNNITSVNTVADNLTDINSFANTYLGPYSTPPTQDPDGSALDLGDLYFNTTDDALKVYTATGWVDVASSVNGTANRFAFTATQNQTTFSGADDDNNTLAYDAGFVDVYMNGVKLVDGSDFTASNGTSIVLPTGADLDDVIYVVAYGTFSLANLSIGDLTDVNLTGLANESVLIYNSTTNRFEPGTSLTGSQINLGDNEKILLGDDNDLEIFHSGSHSFIKDTGTGNLYIDTDGNGIFLRVNTNQIALEAYNGAGVKLRYANAVKFETTSAGIDVTGTVTMDGGSTSGDFTFGDNDKAIFGDGNDLQIYHDGTNSYVADVGPGHLGISTTGTKVIINKSPFENMAEFIVDSAVNLYHNNVKKFATTSGGIDVTGTVTSDGADLDGAVTINESGADVDFRVESATNTHALFVQGSDGHVGIGTVPSSSYALHVSDADGILVESTGTAGIHKFVRGTGATTDSRPVIDIDADSQSDAVDGFGPTLRFTISDTAVDDSELGAIGFVRDGSDTQGKFVIGQDSQRLGSVGETQFSVGNAETVVNDQGADTDFRVESDTNTHALFVQGSDGRVGIGTSSLNGKLDIRATNERAVNIVATESVSNQVERYEFALDYNYTMDGTTLATNRTKAPFLLDIDVDGTTGAGGSVPADGTRESVYAGIVRTTSAHTAGTLYSLVGLDAAATHDASANVSVMTGQQNAAFHTGTGSLSSGAYGSVNISLKDTATNGGSYIGTASYARNSSGAGTMSNATAYQGYLEQNSTSTITEGYIYRGWVTGTGTGQGITTAYGLSLDMDNGYAGTIGTAYGVYVADEDKNYFSGSVGIGTLVPSGPFDVRAGTTSRTYVNNSGKLIVESGIGGDVLQLSHTGPTTDAAASPYMEFSRASAIGGNLERLGYFGYGSISNTNFDWTNDIPGASNRVLTRKSDNSDYIYPVIFTASEINFNATQEDLNFRVESVNSSNAFFVDGFTARVGIGTNLPAATLDARGNNNSRFRFLQDGKLYLESGQGGDLLTLAHIGVSNATNAQSYINFGYGSGLNNFTRMGYFGYGSTSGTTWNWVNEVNGAEARIYTRDSSGTYLQHLRFAETEVNFNVDQRDIDFRVESNTNANALFVRASDSRVGINQSNPQQALDVSGTATADVFIAKSSSFNTTTDFEIKGNGVIRAEEALYLAGGASAGTNGIFFGTKNVADSTGGWDADITQRMHIKNDGDIFISSDVGIGVSVPTQALDVSGSIKASGDVNITGRIGATDGGYGTSGQILSSTGTGTSWVTPSAGITGSGSNDRVAVWNSSSSLDSSANLTFNGSVLSVSSIVKGSGTFNICHPLKPDTHRLVHSFIEGPQADNLYRGQATLVNGSATVNIDTEAGMTEGTFVALNRDVQCFVSNESGWTAVKGSVSGNTLTITAQDNTCTDTVSWLVIGERQDQHMYESPLADENGKIIVEPLV